MQDPFGIQFVVDTHRERRQSNSQHTVRTPPGANTLPYGERVSLLPMATGAPGAIVGIGSAPGALLMKYSQ